MGWESYVLPDSITNMQLKMNIQAHLQFESTKIEVVVLFAEKIPQYSGRVTTADLVGWQQQIQTLHHVPYLRCTIGIELSVGRVQICDNNI